jgi:hypothetical protein
VELTLDRLPSSYGALSWRFLYRRGAYDSRQLGWLMYALKEVKPHGFLERRKKNRFSLVAGRASHTGRILRGYYELEGLVKARIAQAETDRLATLAAAEAAFAARINAAVAPGRRSRPSPLSGGSL